MFCHCATDLSSILYCITSPYIPNGWREALKLCNLSHLFPNLIHDITYGSPIGNPPPLTHTFIPDNLASVNLKAQFISDDIVAEVTTGRMSGPFSVEEAQSIFQGHFRTSPLGLVPKPGKGPDSFCMICHLSKRDSSGFSTNNWIDSDDFPTEWSSAAQCVDFVCTLSPSPTPHCSPSSLPTRMAIHLTFPHTHYSLSSPISLPHLISLSSRPLTHGFSTLSHSNSSGFLPSSPLALAHIDMPHLVHA